MTRSSAIDGVYEQLGRIKALVAQITLVAVEKAKPAIHPTFFQRGLNFC